MPTAKRLSSMRLYPKGRRRPGRSDCASRPSGYNVLHSLADTGELLGIVNCSGNWSSQEGADEQLDLAPRRRGRPERQVEQTLLRPMVSPVLLTPALSVGSAILPLP